MGNGATVCVLKGSVTMRWNGNPGKPMASISVIPDITLLHLFAIVNPILAYQQTAFLF